MHQFTFGTHDNWSHWWEQTADAALGEAAAIAGSASARAQPWSTAPQRVTNTRDADVQSCSGF